VEAVSARSAKNMREPDTFSEHLKRYLGTRVTESTRRIAGEPFYILITGGGREEKVKGGSK